jgi:hypothetical protein
MGEITCLSKDAAGVVTVTGTITRSGKRSKDGKDDKKAPEAPGAPSAPNVPAPTAADDDTAFLDEVVPWDDAELAEPVRRGRDGRDRDGKGERGRRGKGERQRGGGELAGKDFAFTIDAASKPQKQKFSQPTIGDKGTLAACSGGGTPTLEVTRGGFKTREAGAEEAKGDKGERRRGDRGDRDDRRGRRGGWGR